MASLAAIQKQIAELERQAQAIRRHEAKAAAAKAKELIARYGLSAEDLGLAGKGGRKAVVKPTAKAAGARRAATAPKPAGIAKYRDPKTGKTWTGVGKAPGWIAGAKHRDKFLIAVVDSTAAAGKAAVPAAVLPAKRAVKQASAARVAAGPAPVAKKASKRRAAPKKAVAAAVSPSAPAVTAPQ